MGRVLAAKQAVYTAVWAINVLKRFAKRASALWKGRYFISKQVQSVAMENWLMVQQVACFCTAARREVAQHAVDSFLTVGMDQVVNRIVAEKQAEKPQKRLKTFVKSRKFRSHSIANSFLQFFLTEFDGHGDDESSQEGSIVEEQSPCRQVDKEESKAAPPMPLLRQSSRYWDLINTQNNGEQEKKRRKTYDFEDERVKNLLRRHLDTVRQVEAERKRRVKMLEASKSNRDLLTKEESNKGKAEKAVAQKRRQEEFLKKLEGEQKQRQEALQQAKEKQRQRRREQEREALERQEMRKEDDWLQEWTRRQEREAQEKARQAAKQRALRAAAALKKEREREQNKKQVEEDSKKIATEKRPAVPRFPHPVAPRPLSASANANAGLANPVGAVTEASVVGTSGANQPKKAGKLTAEELEAHRHLLQQRLKAQLRAKMMQKRAQAAEEEARRLKVEHVLEAHRAALEKAKQEQRMKRREARRQARLQRESNRQQGDQPEEEEEDSEDSALDDDVIHAISSAKENYSDQPSALMADFGFEDFMDKPLVQVSWPAPPASLDIVTPALTPAAPPPPAEPTRKSKKQPSNQGTTPRSGSGSGLGEEEKENQKKKAIISKLTKKLPKALKNTPYFQHYVKLTAAGLNSIHDLNKREFMHLADGPSAHYTLDLVSEEEDEGEGEEGHYHVGVGVRYASKGVEEGEKDEVVDGEEVGEEEDEAEIDQHSLLSLIDRAKQSLREKQRMPSSSATDAVVQSVSMPIEQVDEVVKEEKEEEEKVEAVDSSLTLAPLTISTGNLAAKNGIPPPSTGVTLDQVLNFHQYRAPPRIPQPPSLTHIPSLAALPAETFSIKSTNKPPQGKSKTNKKAASKVMEKTKSERKPDDTLSKAMAYRAMRKSTSNRYSTSTSPEKAGDGDVLQALSSLGEEREEIGLKYGGVGFMPLPPHLLRDQTKPSVVTTQQSKPTGTSAAQGNSSKIRQKLTRFENYEAKLQADYDALRESFQAKLEQAAAKFSLPLHPSQSEATASSSLPQQQSPEVANGPFMAKPSEQVEQESSQELLQQYLRRSDEISTKDIRDALLTGEGDSDYSQDEEDDDYDNEGFRQAVDSRKTAKRHHPLARSLRDDEEGEESGDNGYDEGEEDEYQAAFYEQRQAAAALDDDFCSNLLSSLGAKVHL
eukprot:scaffold413_cov176-Ochromonas_danica.AAC.5